MNHGHNTYITDIRQTDIREQMDATHKRTIRGGGLTGCLWERGLKIDIILISNRKKRLLHGTTPTALRLSIREKIGLIYSK